MFLTSIIDSEENQAVCIYNAPGAYLNTDMDDWLHVHLDGIPN